MKKLIFKHALRQTPLHFAATGINGSMTELLLSRGANLSARDLHGATPLHWAAQKGHEEVAKVLLAHHADPNQKDAYSQTPLGVAAGQSSLAVVRALLDSRADVSAAPSALRSAAQAGQAEIAQLLLDRGAPVNARGKANDTPLHAAAAMGHRAVAELLLARKADPNVKTTNGLTPLHATIIRTDQDKNVADAVSAAAQLTGVRQDTNYFAAALPQMGKDHAEVAALLLAYHADVDAMTDHGNTPLDFAARAGQRDIAELLLNHGASLSARDKLGCTPFHNAVDRGQVEVAELFLKRGAKVDDRTADAFQGTALHFAAQSPFAAPEKYQALAELLLRHGADVNAAFANTGETPLHRAARNGHIEVAEVLLRNHANLEARDKLGLTPLHWAAGNGHMELVRLLLAHKAVVDAQAPDGSTPLHYAAAMDRREIVELLLANQANAEVPNARGDTPLAVALALRHPEVAQLLQARLKAVRAPSEPDTPGAALSARVGELGEPGHLVFEGLKTFSAKAVKNGLLRHPDFLLASHPAALAAEFPGVVQQLVAEGYLQSGFADVEVSVTLQPKPAKTMVKVKEGARYRAGVVRVGGAKTIPVPQLVRHLAEPYPPPDATVFTVALPPITGPPPQGISTQFKLDPKAQTSNFGEKRLDKTGKEVQTVPAAWPKGEPVSFTAAARRQLNNAVTNALADLGYLFAKFNLQVQREPSRQTADLVVEIQDEGPHEILGDIEISGNQRDSREEILRYLNLAPAVPITQDLITQTELALWRSGRFLEVQLTPERSNSEGGNSKLKLALIEYEKAPALAHRLSTGEQGLLKLADWLSAFPSRNEDLLITISGAAWEPLKDTQLELIISPRSGWLAALRKASAGTKTAVEWAAALTPEEFAWFSARRGSRFSWPGGRGHFRTFLQTEVDAHAEPGHRFELHFGSCAVTEREAAAATNPVVRLDTLFAPVAFLDWAYRTNANLTVTGNLVTYTSKDLALKLDAVSGRLLEYSQSDDKANGTASFRQGLFQETLRALKAQTAKYANTYDSQRPLSSWLGFLTEELLQSPVVAPYLFKGVSAPQRAEAAVVLRRFFEGQVFAAFDEFAVQVLSDDNEGFLIPIDPSKATAQAGNPVVAALAAWVFKSCDGFFPKGSWPWTVTRETVFVMSGKARYTDYELQRLYESKDVGPIGFLTIAKLLARVNPPAARTFATQGLNRLFPEDFRKDYRLLLEGDSPLTKSIQRTAEALRDLKEAEVEALAAILPKEAGESLRSTVRLLRESADKPIRKPLAVALDRLWEQSLRKAVQKALMDVILTPLPRPPQLATPSPR